LTNNTSIDKIKLTLDLEEITYGQNRVIITG
jgi:hypothetical protein